VVTAHVASHIVAWCCQLVNLMARCKSHCLSVHFRNFRDDISNHFVAIMLLTNRHGYRCCN